MLNDESLVSEVLADRRTASITDRDRALYDFVAAVNAAPAAITSADVKRVRNAGWSDDAIYDAITVCALFIFYNPWVDGGGAAELSPDLCAMQAHPLASGGSPPGYPRHIPVPKSACNESVLYL